MEDFQDEIVHQLHIWRNEEEIYPFSHDQPIQTLIMIQLFAMTEYLCQ